MGYIGEREEIRRIRLVPPEELDPAAAPVAEPSPEPAREPVPA